MNKISVKIPIINKNYSRFNFTTKYPVEVRTVRGIISRVTSDSP